MYYLSVILKVSGDLHTFFTVEFPVRLIQFVASLSMWRRCVLSLPRTSSISAVCCFEMTARRILKACEVEGGGGQN